MSIPRRIISSALHSGSERLAPRPPDIVPWWYMVAPSKTLAPGKILRFDLADLPIVLFRGRHDRVVRALPAHCLHQGVDLANGTVIGDCIRCPLHHWEYGGRCYVTAERYGMIFIFRVFDKVSYGLVLNSTRPVNVFDVVQTP